MPDAYAHIAALRAVYTSARFEGYYAERLNASYPNQSLGGYRSNRDIQVLEPIRPLMCLHGIRIGRISGANGTGAGTLEAVTSGSLRWTPPGESTAGTTISIAADETRILPWSTGSAYTKWIEVTRDGSAALAGTETIRLVDVVGNPVAGALHDTEYEPAADSKTYAGIVLWNQSDYGITNLTITAGDSFTDVAAEALQTPANARHASWIQQIADQLTAPSGVSWSWTPCSLAANSGIGLWIRRNWAKTTPYADEASPGTLAGVTISYSCNGEDGLRCDLRGLAQRGLPSLAGYDLYIGTDAVPTFTTPDDHAATVAELSYDATGLGGHTYYWTVLSVDQFDQRCAQPQSYDGHESNAGHFYLDSDEEYHGPAPQEPSSVVVTDIEGILTVIAQYPSTFDADGAANYWVIKYTIDGTDPASSGTTTTETEAVTSDYLYWQRSSALVDETPCNVLVRMRRVDDEGEVDEYTVDSTNTSYTTYTIDYPAGDLRVPRFIQGETGLIPTRGGLKPGGYTDDLDTTVLEASGSDEARLQSYEGAVHLESYISAAAVTRWSLREDLWLLNLNIELTDVSGAAAVYGSDTELGTWDGSNKQVYFIAGGIKRMLVDFHEGTLKVVSMEPANVHNTRYPQGPLHVCYEHLLFNVYEGSTGRWKTVMSLDNSGVLHYDCDLMMATEAECEV